MAITLCRFFTICNEQNNNTIIEKIQCKTNRRAVRASHFCKAEYVIQWSFTMVCPILPWSLQVAAQFVLSSSEGFDSAPLSTKPITESKSRLKTQNTCPRPLPLMGSTLRAHKKKHTSLKYSLNSLQIWQRNHRRQRVSEAHLMFWNVFHWMEEVQSGFLWLCFSETCTAQLATVDSLKAFPLA